MRDDTLRTKIMEPPVLADRYWRHEGGDSGERVVEARVGVAAEVPDGGAVGVGHPVRPGG